MLKSINVETKNMKEGQVHKAVKASNLALKFFQSDYFKKQILATDISALRGESKSSRFKNLSGQEAYKLIQSGKEEWNSEIDFEMDLVISRYYSWWSKVKGYIIPFKPTIHVNGKFFDGSSVMKVASNICHEYVHTLGSRHSGKHLRESLTYLINEWFEFWYENIHSELYSPSPTVETRLVCKRVWWTLWLTKRCYKMVVSPTN